MSVLQPVSEKGPGMEVGLEMQDRPWQHINGDNGRASYHHALPPIAALTTCRPTSARKEDHVFSVPNPPKPPGALLPSHRAPTPFPDSQLQQQRATTSGFSELNIRTSPVPNFPPSSSSSERNHSTLTIVPVPDPVTSTFQSIDQRPLSSPHAYQNRVLPPSESANYPSSLPAEGSRSTTPQVPVPSPSQSSLGGSYEAQRTHTPQNTEYGRNTPGTPHSATLGKEAQGNAVGVVVSSVGGYSADSPRSFTPKHSPAPCPSPRSQGERILGNQISSSQSPASYSPASLGSYPHHSSPHGNPNPRSYTPTSLPSLSITRSFASPQIPTSSEMSNRYSTHSTNMELESLRNVVHNPTSYDIPRSTTQQFPKPSVQSNVPQYSAPNIAPSHDQSRAGYLRYAVQPSTSESSQHNVRSNEKMAGYFHAAESQRVKVSSSTTLPHSTFLPPLATRVSEHALGSGEYASFQGQQQSRQNIQSFSRPVHQSPSHQTYTTSSHSSVKTQPHLPPPQAVPFFRTDTSSVVWTTPSTNVSVSSRPQDSPARQHHANKAGIYPAADRSVKAQVPYQQSHGLPNFYQHGPPQQISHHTPRPPTSREQPSNRGYANYPQVSQQNQTSSSALPRINTSSVVNVTSTFTPRFSSPMNQSNSPYYGTSRAPSSISSEQPRSNQNYLYSAPKQAPSQANNGQSTELTAALPRVNFPSPTAVSFDTSPSLPGTNAYAPSRNSGMASSTSNNQQHYSSARHSSAPIQPMRDIKVSLTAAPQSRHHAYSQVQSHSAYSQQQATSIQVSQPQPRSTPTSVLTSMPSSTTKYTPAQQQVTPNYTHQYRPPETSVSAVRYPHNADPGYRPTSGHFAPPPTRNPSMETDSCRNPFELPPPSNYPRAQQGTSVIKSHPQGQRLEEPRVPQRSGTYLYHQQQQQEHSGIRVSEHLQVPRYAMPTSRAEPSAASAASQERPRPPALSARFPPVPQMNYDLQRQIYDTMTGVQKAPPRLVEKQETDRRNTPKTSNDLTGSSVVSTTAPSGQFRQKKESPLDLSVKTVRQSADSTRDDSDLYVNKIFASDSRMTAAPKIDFTPNFANPLVHPEPRNMVSLPPVQTIRTFVPPQSEPSSHIHPRKRPLPEPEQAPPPKTPKVDAWKLAMDEQIEERLKAARQSRAQPTAALTPINPPLQSTTPTNPELLRVPGFLPSPNYIANMPPRRESPSNSAQLHRSHMHEQMLQQMKKGREAHEVNSQNLRDWSISKSQSLGHGKDSVSISKVPSGFPPDTHRLVQQISQGVMPDSRLLHDRSVVDVLRNSLEEKEARLQQLQDAARRRQKLPPFDAMSIERMHVPPSYKHNVPRFAETVKIGVEPTQNYMRPPAPERPQDGTDLDGLAAFLAARTIRTKAEMKQMGPNVTPFRSPDRAIRPSASGVSPPKLLREGRPLTSPNRRRSVETPVVQLPPRDPTGLRSSSETSVFDFRESDSEGEMPVLERQTLEGMRRDRKTHPKPTPPPPPEPEPEAGPSDKDGPKPEPDRAWENACDMFVDQLQKRPIKRSVRKKKPNPKFFANESETPGFMKVKTEDVKPDISQPVESTAEKEPIKPKIIQEVKQEMDESEIPVPPIKEEDSTSSEELPIKVAKGKTANRRGKAAQSESEWGSSDASQESSSSSSESSSSSSSESESEAESEPKGRRVQTRQQSKKIRPPARMKLRSKQRGANKKADAFRPGWEDEVYKFKQQLRMPERLINVSKPRKRGTTSLPESETESKPAKAGKKSKKGDKGKKEEKLAKKGGKDGGKKKGKKEEKEINVFKGKNKDRPSSAPPLTRRNSGIVTRGKEKILRNGASAAVRRSNKAVQNSKRHLNKGKKLRRKFRSGLDYIRKKKKQTSRKDADVTETKVAEPKPEPKRRERTDGLNISAEVKSWVVNKGAGETVLHRAARLGYADVAAYCLDKLKMKPSPRDHAGYTPLHEACSRGHLNVAKSLLQYGASVSESARGGVRPLHQAAENNYIELVRLLLSFGADPLLATYTGQTALSLASQEDVRELITQHLADVQGQVAPKWPFKGPATIFADPEWAVDPLEDPPSPELVPIEIEIEASSSLLPPLYRLPDDESNERWLLVQDLVAYTQSRSVDALLSKLPGATKREITDDDFKDRAACCNILSAPRSTGGQIQLLRYDDAVRQIMDVELVTVSLLVDE